MSRKAETIFTASMQNKAAHQQRKAARAARRQARAFQNYALANLSANAYYVSMHGVAMPVSR